MAEKTLSELLVPWIKKARADGGGLVFEVKRERPGSSGEDGQWIEISHAELGPALRFRIYEFLEEGQEKFEDGGEVDLNGPPDSRKWSGLGKVLSSGGDGNPFCGYDSFDLSDPEFPEEVFKIEVGENYGMLRSVPIAYEGWWDAEWSVEVADTATSERELWEMVAFFDVKEYGVLLEDL